MRRVTGPRGASVGLRSVELCRLGGSLMDLLDGAEDHRRGAPDGPAHQVPWAVAVVYLGEPLLGRRRLAAGAVMSQHVSMLARSSGAGSGSAVRMLASPIPLEYSIEWLTCAFASRLDVVLVSLPDAAQDRLPADVARAENLIRAGGE